MPRNAGRSLPRSTLSIDPTHVYGRAHDLIVAPSSLPCSPFEAHHASVPSSIDFPSMFVSNFNWPSPHSHFCADFIIIPFLFYIVVVGAGLSLVDLRKHGWLFDLGNNASGEAWYKMYSYLGAFTSSLTISKLLTFVDRFQRCTCGRYLGDFTYSICIVRVVCVTGVFLRFDRSL